MSQGIGKEKRKEVMKDIIRRLHEGLSLEEAKRRFEEEIGNVTSAEIAEIEQGLMNEGIPPEEIKRFCNVHALLFQSALEKSIDKEESPAHPVYLMKQDNREIEKITAALKETVRNSPQYGLAQFRHKVGESLERLKNLDIHYTWKEQILFPYLEKYGFYGPSKVMWGKDDEIRTLLKKALDGLESLKEEKDRKAYVSEVLHPLVEEVEGMIFKEEKILFPTSLEKLNVQDWVEVLKETETVGYGFIQKPKETDALIEELRRAVTEEPKAQDQTISLPTGSFKLEELLGVLNTLPIDITFIDRDDTVRYFSEGKERIFLRTKSILGRKVQNCHPPKSVDVVEKILRSFKEGKRNSAEFWIPYQGKYVYIRYFPVRDRQGKYLGTLEVSQDIAGIQTIKGEKRLLDEEKAE
jgi:PAS domain S-box-containing protein